MSENAINRLTDHILRITGGEIVLNQNESLRVGNEVGREYWRSVYELF